MCFSPSPTYSSFHDCKFSINEDSIIGNTIGMTIWACEGIDIRRTEFSNFSLEGILGVDMAPTIVDQNVFSNNQAGIRSYSIHGSTQPITIGALDENQNVFIDNDLHIDISTSHNAQVVNNQISGGEIGILMDGETKNYSIRENNFKTQKTVSIGGLNCGTGQSDIVCNTYRGNGFGTLYFKGDNLGMNMTNNELQSGPLAHVWLNSNNSNEPGRIPNQGSQALDPNNCFSETGFLDFSVSSDFIDFNYVVPTGEPIGSCKIPSASNSLTVISSPTAISTDCEQLAPVSSISYSRFLELNNYIENSPNYVDLNEPDRAEYINMVYERNSLEELLIKQGVIQNDYDFVAQVINATGGRSSSDALSYAYKIEGIIKAEELLMNSQYPQELTVLWEKLITRENDIFLNPLDTLSEKQLISFLENPMFRDLSRSILALLSDTRVNPILPLMESLAIDDRSEVGTPQENRISVKMLKKGANSISLESYINRSNCYNLLYTGSNCRRMGKHWKQDI